MPTDKPVSEISSLIEKIHKANEDLHISLRADLRAAQDRMDKRISLSLGLAATATIIAVLACL